MLTVLALALVIAIHDGDTMTIQQDNKPLIIRLAEIDAPELRQAHGQESKQALVALCLNKPVDVAVQTKDRYGRTVARVKCGGTDANLEQVRAGMAWVFDRYVTDRSLYDVQAEARRARRGLWSDESPTPPWEWRHK